MGSQGAKLYQDDEAADLKSTIALVCKAPWHGDRLLDILVDMFGNADPRDEDAIVFWLVVADQFERRGIECSRARSTALSLIERGADTDRLASLGASDQFLSSRRRDLDELAQRLRSPRAVRVRKTPATPPEFWLDVGEIHVFRTSGGFACSPYRLQYQGPFEADGWGAMIVLDRGRAFDWVPWCALASLTVDPTRRPTLEDACQAQLITHMQTNGAARCVPKRAHLATMGAELIGRVALDAKRVAPVLSTLSISSAIAFDWSVDKAAYSRGVKGPKIGAALQDLLMRPD